MKKNRSVLVTAHVYRDLTPRIEKRLGELNVNSYHVQTSRATVLHESSSMFGLIPAIKLDDDPSDIIRINTVPGSEDNLMKTLAEAAELNLPGRGSIFCESVELAGTNAVEPLQKDTASIHLAGGLAAVCCIVQRGEGSVITRAALDMGMSVPAVTFGEGTGLRDKLGLLRITIPAEKDVIQLPVALDDAGDVMNALVEAGRLDQPGRGFIYYYPLMKGLLNTKIFRGRMRHAASMEQVIAAIDDVRGGMEWRRKSISGQSQGAGRCYLSDLVNMTIICNEGHAEDLVRAAMNAGAGGATISRLQYRGPAVGSITPAREMSDLVVSASAVDKIQNAMDEAGLFKEAAGYVERKPVPGACTYLGASR